MLSRVAPRLQDRDPLGQVLGQNVEFGLGESLAVDAGFDLQMDGIAKLDTEAFRFRFPDRFDFILFLSCG